MAESEFEDLGPNSGLVEEMYGQYVEDPKYLTREYTTSMHFKREPNGSKWKPAPCRNMKED